MDGTRDAEGPGPALAQGMKVLGAEQTAFDAEVAAIEAVARWMVQQRPPNFRHIVVRSGSTNAIARVRHTGAGPCQRVAVGIFDMLPELYLGRRSVVRGRAESQAAAKQAT